MSDDTDASGGENDSQTDWAKRTTLGVAPTWDETTADPPSSRPGQMLAGRYRILNLLGEGGMGNVFRVSDEELDEVVALKTLRRELADNPTAVARFREEVKLARRVTHPNVARTYDLGTAGEVPFITMEYIDGEGLDGVLRSREVISPGRVWRLVVAICRGLEAAHRSEIVHRDLKPSNVLIEDGGRIVISDFGIARLRGGNSKLTDGVVGTPAYMAPEQVRGREVDERTDIFALGVMTYQMVTGEMPWEGPNGLATATQRVLNPAPEISEKTDAISERFAEVAMRALKRDPEDRFQGAGELIEALEETPEADGDSEASADRSGRVGRVAFDTGETSSQRFNPGDAREASTQSVAVLPFAVRGTGDAGHFAEGFVQELTDELCLSKGLRVKSTSMVSGFDPDGDSAREAGRDLGVRVVIEGRIWIDDRDLRVRLAAISVEEGFQLWAGKFEGSTGELFEISAEAAEAISEALTVGRTTSVATELDPVTMDMYMRARHQLRAKWTNRGLDEVVALFDRALDRAPDNPRVVAGAAVARARSAFMDMESEQVETGDAKSLVELAKRTAPQAAEPHYADAILRWIDDDLAGAIDAAQTALKRAPGYYDALQLLGVVYNEIGPLEHATSALEQVAQDSDHAVRELAKNYAFQGEWQKVDVLLDRPAEHARQQAMRMLTRARLNLWRPNPRELDQSVDSQLLPHDLIEYYIRTAEAVAKTGELPDEGFEPDELFDRLAWNSRMWMVALQEMCELEAFVGEYDRAAKRLQQAGEAGLVDKMWLLHCPLIRRLEGRPEYQEALDEVSERIRQTATPASGMQTIELPDSDN